MKWPPWLCRLVPYLGRRQADEDLQGELRLHLELERERQRDAGVSEDEALRAARRTLGNAALIRERTRDVWGWRWLDDLGRDLRHAVRGLRRDPGFAATVALILALGIGANTAMFGIVYGMLIRPLPYPDAEALVRVGQGCRGDSRWSGPGILSGVQMAQVSEARSFEHIAAYRESVEWASPDGAVTLRGAVVSPSLFPLLRARPHLGRLFNEGEARLGAHRVVLLSHGAWIRRFGSDPDIVGKAVEFAYNLDAGPHTVVGVLAEGFYFPNATTEVWTPFVIPTDEPSDPDGLRLETTISSAALGRLAPSVSPERAATELHTLLQRNGRTNISCDRVDGRARPAAETPEMDARVIPLQEAMTGEYRPALLALTAAMALVLLIACTNVAGLLLARGVTRQRALAVCAALGAGRGRIVRQLLTESVVLSVIGGAMGLAAASVVLRVVPALVPDNVARLDKVGVDGVVLAFTLGLSLVVGLAFGAVPAFQWPRLPLVRVLNEGSAQSTGGFRLLRSSRTRAALATAQVALALVLLIGAGLFLRSFVGLLTIDRGYDAANVIAAVPSNPDLDIRHYQWKPEGGDGLLAVSRRFSEGFLQSTERLERLPGVAAVGVSSSLPLAFSGGYVALVHPAGRAAPGNFDELPLTWLHLVSPGYLDVMRLRLRAGRFFTRLDGARNPPVVVVNETLAREMFGGEPAVGQGLVIDAGDVPWQVVGVVADVRYEGLAGSGSRAEAFVSVHQPEAVSRIMPFSNLLFLAVRTAGDPLAVVPFLHEAVTEAHPRATIEDVRTMDARLSAAVAQPRFYAGFVGFFAALAVFLAAFGIYGLLSYTVAHRRREIGVRMALGAQRGDIVGLVVRQGAMLVAAGAVVGLAAAAASSRVLESFLYGIATDDRLTFLAAPLVLVAVALVACWLPARRATRVDPMEVLRFE